DLLYRLNIYPIRIPPLRERGADIELLAQTLLARFTALHGKRLQGFSERALQALGRHGWPGNVRELENLVERGVILAAQGGAIEVEDLFSLSPGHGDGSADRTGLDPHGQLAVLPPDPDEDLCARMLASGLPLEELEHQLLAFAVARESGNLSAAARRLGITRPQLAYRLRRGPMPSEPGAQ
ncbi:MAG: hypothetical protein RLZZ373_1596, partial [Pseudomonadota bacterium]